MRAAERRVLHLQPAVAVGGAERQASLVLPQLEAYGYEATAVAGPGREIFRWFEQAGFHRTFWSPHFPGPSVTPWQWPAALRDLLQLVEELDRLHERRPFDVVTGSLGYGWAAAGVLGVRWGIPSVWRAGGLSFGNTTDHSSTEAQALRMLVQLLAPSALVCNARAVVDWWRPVLALPSFVVPNAVVVPEHPTRRVRNGPFVVGFLGRLSAEKHLDLLVHAIALVRSRGLDLRGLFAGPGRSSELMDHIARLGLRASVRVLNGSMEAEELYRSVDALALPSRSEGCPNVLLEAMARGLPVVATAVGGIPEIVEHARTGLLVGPGDVEGFARALVTLAKRPRFAASLGRQARRRMARYSPDASAKALAGVLDEVITRAAPRSRVRATARETARPTSLPSPA